jgi:hypothetical protein
MVSTPQPTCSPRYCFGGAKAIALCVLAVLGFVATMAMRMLRDSASDIGFVIGFSLACVVGVAIVAPGRFTGKYEEPGDFSAEIEKLHEGDVPGEPPRKRKWE